MITKTLHDYLIKNGISEKDSIFLSYIQNKILITDFLDDEGYCHIHKDYFKNKIGRDYRNYINTLLFLGEIDIDETYCFLTSKSDQKFIPRTKGYKVPYEKQSLGLIKIDYSKKRVKPLKEQKTIIEEKKKRRREEEKGRRSICGGIRELSYLLKCLGEVRVDDNIIIPYDDIKKYVKAKQLLEKTYFKSFGLHRSESGRVYHTIIEMPKGARQNLYHSSGIRFVEIDIKTCHPHLLLNKFSNQDEKDRFYHDLRNDLYERFIDIKNDRKKIKKRMSQFLMSKNRDLQWIRESCFYYYFSANFPIFTAEILNKDNNLAMYLQGRESDIVTRKLALYCAENNLFLITCHDGGMTLPDHKNEVVRILKTLLKEETGYCVEVN